MVFRFDLPFLVSSEANKIGTKLSCVRCFLFRWPRNSLRLEYVVVELVVFDVNPDASNISFRHSSKLLYSSALLRPAFHSSLSDESSLPELEEMDNCSKLLSASSVFFDSLLRLRFLLLSAC